MKDNIILDKSFGFAVRIVQFSRWLQIEKKEFILSKQVLRSGTSIGANIEEAVGGISTKEFTAKMQIAYKEARETRYWLRLLQATDTIPANGADSLIQDCEELLRILVSIIKSSKVPSS
jgi:four helix bundle protein